MSENLRPLLEKALLHAGGMYSFGDLVHTLQQGGAQAWGTERAALVTEVVDYPQRRVGRVWLAAGDMDEVIRLAEGPAATFARGAGCDTAEIVGRDGWERMLRNRGWRKVAIVLRKELRG